MLFLCNKKFNPNLSDLHSGEFFGHFVGYLRGLLDRIAPSLTEAERASAPLAVERAVAEAMARSQASLMRKVEDLSSRVEEQKQEAMKEWQEQIRQEEERIAAEVAKVWPNAKARIAEREQVNVRQCRR